MLLPFLYLVFLCEAVISDMHFDYDIEAADDLCVSYLAEDFCMFLVVSCRVRESTISGFRI